jgi:hypothetical protein
MNMNQSTRKLLFFVALLAIVVRASGEPPKDPLEVARESLKADRQEVVAAAIPLTDAEAKDFWPIYHQYRGAMDMVGDGLVKLVRDYAEAYPDVSEDSARELTRDYLALEKKYLDTRIKYFKKVSEVLPATKTLRFIQVENRLDLALRLQLAAGVPLAPEKK